MRDRRADLSGQDIVASLSTAMQRASEPFHSPLLRNGTRDWGQCLPVAIGIRRGDDPDLGRRYSQT